MPVDPLVAARRQAAVTRLRLLDRAGDPALTAVTRVAAYVAGGGAAAIHVFDCESQHRVAATRACLGAHPRDDAMCRLAVDSAEPIICDDAVADGRFAYSTFVRGDAAVRFYASLPLAAADGAVVGTLCAWDTGTRTLAGEQVDRLADLALQAASHLELVGLASDLGHAASHDGLTGLANRFVLDDRLTHAFARQLRQGGEILVAVVDLDGFKAINDTHGHDAGDRALVEVAHRLSGAVRAQDTVARIGGDEFALVAEVAGGAQATALTERIEAAVGVPIPVGAGATVCASVGATLTRRDDDARSALARADRAMYARKAAR